MAETPKQLEQELRVIWQNAPNTRKRSTPKRVQAILESSRSELSLRDLLIFFTYLGLAFFSLLSAVVHALFTSPPANKTQESKK